MLALHAGVAHNQAGVRCKSGVCLLQRVRGAAWVQVWFAVVLLYISLGE